MAITERRAFFLKASLLAAMGLLLLSTPSSPAETKTTCQRVPAPNGGHWTIKTTVTFKAPRTTLKRKCSNVVGSTITARPQTATEAKIESKEYIPYEFVSETFKNDQPTTKARIADDDYWLYKNFEEYDNTTKDEITVSPQTTTDDRNETEEYFPYKIVEESSEYNQTITEATITNVDNNAYNITVDNEEYVQVPIENTSSSEKFYQYNIIVDSEQEGQPGFEGEVAGSASPLTPSPPTVRSDYVYYDGVGYYKLHQTLKTWLEAKQTCEEEGGHLAIINSKEEEKAIVSLISPNVMMYDNVYIGFHDRNNEGQFVTVLGDPLQSAGYANWAMGQPSDSVGLQNCGTVIGSGVINDYYCDENLYFLCELPLL